MLTFKLKYLLSTCIYVYIYIFLKKYYFFHFHGPGNAFRVILVEHLTWNKMYFAILIYIILNISFCQDSFISVL